MNEKLVYNNNNNNTLIYIAPACRMTSVTGSIPGFYRPIEEQRRRGQGLRYFNEVTGKWS